jgi:hypothetical protein
MRFDTVNDITGAEGNFFYEMSGEVTFIEDLGNLLMPKSAFTDTSAMLSDNPEVVYFNFFLRKEPQIANEILVFQVMEDDLKINGKSIVQDGILATEAYKNGDFITFGQKMGEILQLTTQKQEVEEIVETEEKNPRTMAQVLQGFLKATNVGKFNFTALLECIYAEDQAALEFYAAIDILKSAIKDKSIGEGIAGTIFTFAAFQ